MWINKEVGYLQDWITQLWVKMTGRTFSAAEDHWLTGPMGDTEIIKDKFIKTLTEQEELEVAYNPFGSGLLEDFGDLGLTKEETVLIDPKVRDFYERTSNYNFEIWSEWCGFFKPFGWLLSIVFSKRLQQLNLPLSPLDSAKGIDSNIIKLIDRSSKATKWTIWYRILKSTGRVIYSGVYTTCNIPNHAGKCLKVIFPLPNGNATVVMRKEVLSNGSLKLSSDGKKFGDNGFYFTIRNKDGKYWARFVKSMHEWITVYVDDDDMLRVDHNLKFYGFPFLKLHYKMQEKKMAKAASYNVKSTTDIHFSNTRN